MGDDIGQGLHPVAGDVLRRHVRLLLARELGDILGRLLQLAHQVHKCILERGGHLRLAAFGEIVENVGQAVRGAFQPRGQDLLTTQQSRHAGDLRLGHRDGQLARHPIDQVMRLVHHVGRSRGKHRRAGALDSQHRMIGDDDVRFLGFLSAQDGKTGTA